VRFVSNGRTHLGKRLHYTCIAAIVGCDAAKRTL